MLYVEVLQNQSFDCTAPETLTLSWKVDTKHRTIHSGSEKSEKDT